MNALHRARTVAMAAVLPCLLAAGAAAAGSDWSTAYRRGLKALDAGRLDAARRAFEEAVAANPNPEGAVRTYGSRTLPYLPYVHLAAVAYRAGDLPAAERWLDRSRSAGVAQTSDAGRALLLEQELLVENLRFVQAAERGELTGESARYRRTDRDRERERLLAEQVSSQCGQPPPGKRKSTPRPWYYHHALARKLEAHGDPVGSLQHAAQALAERPEPGEFVRTYGMGFVTYSPWYDLGRTHARLGNWQCAADALELSMAREKFLDDGAEGRQRAELLAGARLRLEGGSSER